MWRMETGNNTTSSKYKQAVGSMEASDDVMFITSL